MNNEEKTLGDLLEQKREEKGLKVEKVALYADISEGYLRKLENGDAKSPSFQIISRLANALEIPINSFRPIFIGEKLELELEEEVWELEGKAPDDLVANLYTLRQSNSRTDKLEAERDLLRELTK